MLNRVEQFLVDHLLRFLPPSYKKYLQDKIELEELYSQLSKNVLTLDANIEAKKHLLETIRSADQLLKANGREVLDADWDDFYLLSMNEIFTYQETIFRGYLGLFRVPLSIVRHSQDKEASDGI